MVLERPRAIDSSSSALTCPWHCRWNSSYLSKHASSTCRRCAGISWQSDGCERDFRTSLLHSQRKPCLPKKKLVKKYQLVSQQRKSSVPKKNINKTLTLIAQPAETLYARLNQLISWRLARTSHSLWQPKLANTHTHTHTHTTHTRGKGAVSSATSGPASSACADEQSQKKKHKTPT